MTKQTEHHAYLDGVYQGVFMATAEQLKEMGMVTGEAPTVDPVAALAQERAQMTCTPMQGQLALGEANWNVVLAYRDQITPEGKPATSFAERTIIDGAQSWRRLSQNIQFFQYLLKFTPEQVDDLFRAAMKIEV